MIALDTSFTEVKEYFVRASSESSDSVGHWSAILVLVLFFLSNLAVLFPIHVPIPSVVTRAICEMLIKMNIMAPPTRPLRRRHIRLNFITVPLVSVLILLASGAIDGSVIRRGIIGADGVKPINIMALFISLAYMSISLDFTGLLRFSAFWVARKGGTSGKLLYLYLYCFFLVCGVIVGNDPVILSGTAFLAYFTRVTGITPPTAWVFAQFTAANMASVVLVSSNPTNLVLSGGFSLSFMKYTAHVIIPFLAGAVCVFPVLLFAIYRSPRLVPPSLGLELSEQESGSQTLVDKSGAIFGSILLLTTLAVLVGTSTVGVPVWQVTVPPACVMILRDTWHDWRHDQTAVSQHNREQEEIPREYPLAELSPPENGDQQPDSASATIQEQPSGTQTPSDTGSSESASTLIDTSLVGKITAFLERIERRFPTVSTIAHRLPIPLLPFAFLMFILVQGLSSKGWVEVFANWWNAWVNATGTIGAIGGMGFVACMLCNICGTNIGATILLARVLQVWTSNTTVDQRTRDGAIYALAIGSNYGAFSLTFSASLAGLLWRQILLQKGIHVRARQFLMLNLPVSFVAMLCSSAVLVGQVYIIDKKQ